MEAQRVTFKCRKLIKLLVPYVKEDADGKIVFNKTITFHQGSKSMGILTPAFYATSNKDEIKYLTEYPGNGVDYDIVKSSSDSSKKDAATTLVSSRTPGKVIDEADLVEVVSNDAATVQQAYLELRKVDKKVPKELVNDVEKLKTYALGKGIEFVNL